MDETRQNTVTEEMPYGQEAPPPLPRWRKVIALVAIVIGIVWPIIWWFWYVKLDAFDPREVPEKVWHDAVWSHLESAQAIIGLSFLMALVMSVAIPLSRHRRLVVGILAIINAALFFIALNAFFYIASGLAIT